MIVTIGLLLFCCGVNDKKVDNSMQSYALINADDVCLPDTFSEFAPSIKFNVSNVTIAKEFLQSNDSRKNFI